MDRRIVKAKIANDGKMTIQYEETVDGVTDIVDRVCEHEATDDLVNAFAAIDIHLATVTDQGVYTEFEEDKSKLDIFRTTGISMGGSDEHVGVTITGIRNLKTGDVLNLNSPFTKLNTSHSKYNFAESLDFCVNALLSELNEYLNGKHRPKRQLEMFHKDDAGEGEVKKKGKKAKQVKMDSFADQVESDLKEALGDDVDISISALR